MTRSVVNVEQAQAWNGYEGRHWADNQDRWDAVTGGATEPLFAAAAIGHRDRVLDVGCGNGQTTRLAARLAPRGHALGIDLSAPMLDRARVTAAGEGLANVRFEQGDAQVHPFPPGGFDVAISRYGVMFFADPVAAFANIGRALVPGGRLAFVCMRDPSHGDLGVLFSALAEFIPVSAGSDAGMFSLADPARIDEILTGAGFERVSVAAVDVPMVFGRDPVDAAEFFVDAGPVRAVLDRIDRASARDALTAALRPYQQPDGVRLRGASWLVTATRPR